MNPSQILWKLPSTYPPYLHTHVYFFLFFNSVFTQQSYCRCAPVHHPSINSGFSETAAWIQTKFCGKVPIHHYRHHNDNLQTIFFSFFKILNFHIFFFSFSLTWDPTIAYKHDKGYLSPCSIKVTLGHLVHLSQNCL